jgi:uncharacterized protein (TIGR03435 family)
MRMLHLGVAIALFSSPGAAQGPPATPGPIDRLTFEVASIKQNKSGSASGGANAQPGGRVTVRNTSLYDLVRNGQGLQPYEVAAGERLPSWVTTDRWDIEAKGPEQATQPQLRTMLQNLLTDRFKLVTRRETRDVPVYALVLSRADGRLGSQIRQSAADCAALAAAARTADGGQGGPRPCGRDVGPGVISAIGTTIPDFARGLSLNTGRFVMDATGLTGRFDIDLKWTPDQAIGGAGAQTDGTSLFAAIQEQLGLRLDARQAPVNVLVIESAERPAED